MHHPFDHTTHVTEAGTAWLLDGHNILYAARANFSDFLVDGHPSTAAREALIERVVAAFAGRPQRLFLYFDGSKANSENRSTELEVRYSGGEGEQRADRAILCQARQLLAGDDPPPVLVVTRDLKLARRARKRGAHVMAPEEFLELLGKDGSVSGSSTNP